MSTFFSASALGANAASKHTPEATRGLPWKSVGIARERGAFRAGRWIHWSAGARSPGIGLAANRNQLHWRPRV